MKTLPHSPVAALIAAGAILTALGLNSGVAAQVAAQGQAQPSPIGSYYPPSYTQKSSTLEEGYARGLADAVRSAGAANLMHSQAALNYEDARAKYFDNRLRATQTYFEMKQLNQTQRAAMEGQRVTAEQLFRIAKMRAPDPLSPSELDPYSGEIRWPTLLLAPDYAENRVLVEDLVRKRVSDVVGMTVEEQAALRAALDSLAAQMQGNIAAYDPKEYASTKNFLHSLAATTGVGAL